MAVQVYILDCRILFFLYFLFFSPSNYSPFQYSFFNSNLKSPLFSKQNHKTFQLQQTFQNKKNFLFYLKIPYFKTNHKTSYPNNTFQNKDTKTTHFLSTIYLFIFFYFLSILLKRLCHTYLQP